jgi:hypothetical protein
MGPALRQCSFCGLDRAGGVAGPKGVYICPACIDLAHQIRHGPPRCDPEDRDDPPGSGAAVTPATPRISGSASGSASTATR